MQDKNVLQNLFKQDAIIPLTKDAYGKLFLTLIEPHCPNSSAIIHHIPEDAIALKVDMFPAPISIFQNSKGECKRADFAVIIPSKQCILFIEMKHSNASRKIIQQQLRGALCCMEYCKHIARHFWNEQKFLEGYKLRFIFLGRTSPEKRKTRISSGNTQKHDTPDNYMTIKHPNRLYFNQIASLR